MTFCVDFYAYAEGKNLAIESGDMFILFLSLSGI